MGAVTMLRSYIKFIVEVLVFERVCIKHDGIDSVLIMY